MKQSFAFIAAFALLFYITGCKTGEQKLSKQEALEIAQSIEKDVINRKIDFLSSRILAPALLQRMYQTKKVKAEAGMEQGVRQGLANNNYEKSIYALIGSNGSFQLVKYYEKENKPRLIFRAFSEGGGINYLDMELTKLNDKKGIADIFIYTSGENLSVSLAEMMSKINDHYESGIGKRIKSISANVNRYKADNDYQSAKEEFLKLPYNIRNTKIMETSYLDILSNLDQDEYMAELEKMEKKYADQPHFQLTLLDAHILRKEYDKALASINKIDEDINKDPMLDYYRAIMYSMKNEKDTALDLFLKVNKAYPELNDVNLEIAVNYADRKKQEEAQKYFDAYQHSPKASEEVVSYYKEQYPFLD
ncbi:MAG: hypothetical protein QM687_10230 [Ferruginibacter sp.]